MGNLGAGGLAAGAIAVLLIAITSGGEYGWKIALAVLGLVLWVVGGLSKES